MGLPGDTLDAHFGFPIHDQVEKVNARFKERLFQILSG